MCQDTYVYLCTSMHADYISMLREVFELNKDGILQSSEFVKLARLLQAINSEKW